MFQACLIQVIGKRWFESTCRIFRLTSVGSKVSIDDEDSIQCTICFNDFCNPIKVSVLIFFEVSYSTRLSYVAYGLFSCTIEYTCIKFI